MVNLIVENKDIWFQYGKPIEGYNTPSFNYKRFKYIKSARKMAKGIINKYPDAIVIITRYNRKTGRIKSEEWIK